MKRIILTMTILTMTAFATTKAEQKLNERIEKAKTFYALEIAKEQLKKEHEREKQALKIKQAREKAELQLKLLSK